jgi:hypothetical protein
MAATLADEIVRTSTDFDGTERAPMRAAEARITLVLWLPGRVTSKKPFAKTSALSQENASPYHHSS